MSISNCIKKAVWELRPGGSMIGAAVLLIMSARYTDAAPIAYEPFDYGGGVNLTLETSNGGNGWTAAWASAGVNGMLTSGTSRSLAFGQAPPDGLIPDGSNHVFSDGIKGNERDWSPAVDLATQTLYFTTLVRVDGGPTAVDLRAEFYDGVGATGNMRGNVGISNGDLYVDADTPGYLPAGASVAPGLVANSATYLLAMKRTVAGISAALVPANGDLGTLASEPTWQVTQNAASGVDLTSIQILMDGTNGGIRVDELRIATDWNNAVAGLQIPPPDKTFVFAVDQPATSQTMNWTHTVAEAGSYQIGCAWVETLAGGDVALEVFHNSMRVKALYAPPGQVTRFETRLENLAVGDQITVKAIPSGASYRLGCQIAFGTPTFNGLPVYQVAAFGAVGDGVTDDMAAIQAAVAAAALNGGGIVRFDGTKTYRAIGLSNLTTEYLFLLDGTVNIKIEGNGAKVLLHPPDALADIDYADNLQIDGLTVDYDPKPYYQGTITNINVPDMTIDITVPDRYPVPLTGPAPTHAPFFGRPFIPDAPGARSGRGQNIYIQSVAQNGSNRNLRIQVPATANGVAMAPRVQDAFDNQATELVVPHLVHGHLGGQTRIRNSSRIKLSNLRQTCASFFWLGITHNTGPVTLSNVDLKMPNPETELLASWRDGMHIKNGRWGILIEDGDWDGAAMYDDTFALYSRTQEVVGVSGDVATLKPSFESRETFLWQPGDWASFWSPDQMTLRGMARALSVISVESPNYEVTLESIPAGVVAGDIAIHEESLNRGTVIRNCTTTRVGGKSATTRFRGTDVFYQDNHFEEFDFRLEYDTSLATPRARDILIEDCYLNSREGRVTFTRPLGVRIRGGTLDGIDVLCDSRAEAVALNGVAFINRTQNILDIRNTSNAALHGNSSRNGRATGLASWVGVDGTSSFTTATPPGGEAPVVPPSNGEDTEAPAPPTGLTVVARDSEVRLDWNRSPEPDTHSYKVYRAASVSGPYAAVASDLVVSAHLDGGLTNGTSFHYVVTALDNSGNESPFSQAVAGTPSIPVEILYESYDYADGTSLEGGVARGGRGWIGGWTGDVGGLAVIGGKLGQTGGTTRELANPFSLDGPDAYFSFIAKTDASGTFNFNLKQTSGNNVRWAFARNADGSITINGANTIATSAAGLFAADTEYLVVSRYEANGDIARFKLFNTANPADFTTEPTHWDLSADGLSGVNIDRLDVLVTGGMVKLDELRIGRTYQSVAVSPTGYGVWAGGYALVGGPEGDDDKDGVQNLMEFALGGDPTDPADTGFPITTGVTWDAGIQWFTFTYPARSDPNTGILHIPQISETLAPGAWTPMGIETLGTVPNFHGPGFDAVTVRTATTGKPRLFIRLAVRSAPLDP